MIPKIIHYCWFGHNPLSKSLLRCIASWERICPEYMIKEWNEDNYDINSTCAFVRDAYKNKKWAFVSDYVRLDVVYQHGGIYLDTDVELLKSPDELLKNCQGYFGFENRNFISSGVGFAAEQGNFIIKEMMDCYQNLAFDLNKLANLACPQFNTAVLKRHGLKDNNTYQIIEGIKILPTDYLCPENIYDGTTNYSCNTVSIHHNDASWMSRSERKRLKYIIKIKKILPTAIVMCIQKLYKRKK